MDPNDYDFLKTGLEGLAEREAQVEPIPHVPQIPSHYALSLADLRGSSTPQATPPQVSQPQATPSQVTPSQSSEVEIRVSPWDDVATFAELVPRIQRALERVASSGETTDHQAVLALSRRLGAIKLGDPVERFAKSRRSAGDSWRDIADALNDRAESDPRYAPLRASEWTSANLRNLLGHRGAVTRSHESAFELIKSLREAKTSWRVVAEELNARAREDASFSPPRGDQWTHSSTRAYFRRSL
jgi:hypothetical protein